MALSTVFSASEDPFFMDALPMEGLDADLGLFDDDEGCLLKLLDMAPSDVPLGALLDTAPDAHCDGAVDTAMALHSEECAVSPWSAVPAATGAAAVPTPTSSSSAGCSSSLLTSAPVELPVYRCSGPPTAFKRARRGARGVGSLRSLK